MRFFILLLALLMATASCDVIPNDGCQGESWLCNELVQMQNLMTEQNSVIAKLQDKVQNQEQTMLEQDTLLKQLHGKVSNQDKIILEQNHRHEADIKHHKTFLQRQQEALVKLQEERDQDKAAIQFLKMTLDNVLANPKPRMSQLTNCTGQASKPRRSSLTSESRVMTSRADDNGPLEAVVNQMSQQLTTMTADVQALKNSDSQQDSAIQDARTSTYVRWGNSQCPSDAALVYSGVVGGKDHTQPGSGVNYLCLTMNPVPGHHDIPNARNYLYGAEYETEDSHQNVDSLCAVCRTSHSTTIMIPGTNACTQGWTKQYSGFLMAQRETHPAASDFVCVDSAFEGRIGSNDDRNGALFYFTLAQCGSLPCIPYVNNMVVTCVVCSK